MDIQAIAAQVAGVIKDVPEKAQDLLADPKGTVQKITGEKDFDVTEVLQAVLVKLKDSGIDLSGVDLSKIDLSQIDLAKLDLGAIKNAADSLGIDASKLDLGGIAGNLGGMLGGLFGKK